MSIKEEYPKLVREQQAVSPELPDWDKTQPFTQAIELLGENAQETIDFILNDCTSEQLLWMSVIAVEVATRLRTRKFTDALKVVAERYSAELAGYNVNECIKDAEAALADI